MANSSGSGFVDRLKRTRPADPDIDPEMEIQPSVSIGRWDPKTRRFIYGPGRTRDRPLTQERWSPPGQPPPEKSLRKGGRVERTGVYELHKGEYVIPARKRSKSVTLPRRRK